MKKKFLSLIFLMFGISLFAQNLPVFTIMTEDWKPYQYLEEGQLKGITVDLMVLLLKEVGSLQGIEDIKMAPWARGYYTLQNKENTILFSTVRTPERENLFKWVGPIFETNTLLIGKKSRNIVINSPEEISEYVIGTVYDDVGEIYLKRLGVSIENMQRTNWAENNVKMLERDRIDLVVTGWTAFVNDAELAGVDSELYEPIYTVDFSNVNFAFHIDTSDAIINKFQKAFDKIKNSGELDQIFTLYSELFEEH